MVNLLREDVKRWRDSGYEGAENITKKLLEHWTRPERYRRLFFCQVEAVETVIYLNEILASGRRTRWTPRVSLEDYQLLRQGARPSFVPEKALQPTLGDFPNEGGLPLTRYGCKMATGSGKTLVMAMTIAWSFCNRGRKPADERFPDAALVLCPNLTVKERISVLRPDHRDNYYVAFDLVPPTLMPEILKGKVMVENWHRLAPEKPNVEGGKGYAVVDKGEESSEAFGRRILGDLWGRGPIIVLNDEAHHAYRPALIPDDGRLTPSERAEREEATVWVSGLDRINNAFTSSYVSADGHTASGGIRFCVDLSATPFYLGGSGFPEGQPLPWLVSDFGLVDAIESGIVKIPRLPVSDTTGRPEPKYFALWRTITDGLKAGEKLPGGKPKPDVVWREAQDALNTLASQWKERFQYNEMAGGGQDRTPPVLIVVCDNTEIAKLFFERISGESVVDAVEPELVEDDSDEDAPVKRTRKRAKTKKAYGSSAVFEEFSNTTTSLYTLRIDSKLLAEAESEDPNANKAAAAEELRTIVATVGRRGEPGEQVRCVVSVQMLTEGWDANNVTHIIGLRAFGSQLLCEQVVGRGLRRMDYTPDPITGLLSPEYVDVYGIPFYLIPFRGRATNQPAPEDKPKNLVCALSERKHYEMRFPIVEGYAFALRHNQIRANIDVLEPLVLEPGAYPSATFSKPQVGYSPMPLMTGGIFEVVEQDRSEFYETTHMQWIAFGISREVITKLVGTQTPASARIGLMARHQLFPQVFRFVSAYLERKLVTNGVDAREVWLDTYKNRVVERILDAIEPNVDEGELPLLPILNRSKPIGSTSAVRFITTRPVVATEFSHINQVVADTGQWEQIAVFKLEQAAKRGIIKFYARNDHLEFTVPYEYKGILHNYIPDFIVRVDDERTLILEIKGGIDNQDRAKHDAARRWANAVNYWGRLGHWDFHVCLNPQTLLEELESLVNGGG